MSSIMREDWIESKAEDFGELIRGITYNKNQASDIPKDNYLPILRANNINNNKLNFDEIKYVDESLIKDFQRIMPNDILIAMSSGSKHLVGKSAQSKGYYDGSFGAFCSVFRPNENFSGDYVSYFFQSNDFRKNISEISKGSNINNLKREHILDFVFPLAPLPIQRAIVSKIEALFSDLDNGIANFKKAQEQLKIYRQAVLKKAFEGELTKEWREKQTNLPIAEVLLKQIKEERQNHYNQQIEDWKKAVKEWEKNGSVGKKPKKPSALTIPDKPNAEHISRKWELPDNWIWSQIGDVCFVTKLAGFEYTDYVKYEADGDLAVIKAENAGLNGFKKTQYSKIKSESVKMLTRSMIYGGELLVVFVGAGTGNVATVPLNKMFFLGPNIGMARPYFEINTRYIELFLQSPQGKHMLMATVKAVAQPSLSMGTIRQTPFVFCSLQEQIQIVQEIESRLSVCDKMEQSINESILKAEALRQSILKKAFEGKLLSQAEIEQCKKEADYEPASELLKKIKAEKLVKEQTQKRGKKNAK